VLRAGAKKISPIAREAVMTLLSTLDSILGGSKWFAGDDLTLADLAILGTVGTVRCWGVDLRQFKRLNVWYEQCRSLPGFDENHEGSQMLAEKLTKLLEEPLWK
jgi:glutathione S-transferase